MSANRLSPRSAVTFLRLSGETNSRRSKAPLHWILALILVVAALAVARADPLTWRSPDGSIAMTLHDGWQRGVGGDVKRYDNRDSSVIPGSQHRLYLGGLLYRRYASMQVAQFSKIGGNTVGQFIDLLVTRLEGQGLVVQRRYYDGIQKGFVEYRFLHSGDSVSQFAIIVGTATGIFYVEVTAPREDEERLQGEALQILSSASVLRRFQ